MTEIDGIQAEKRLNMGYEGYTDLFLTDEHSGTEANPVTEVREGPRGPALAIR